MTFVLTFILRPKFYQIFYPILYIPLIKAVVRVTPFETHIFYIYKDSFSIKVKHRLSTEYVLRKKFCIRPFLSTLKAELLSLQAQPKKSISTFCCLWNALELAFNLYITTTYDSLYHHLFRFYLLNLEQS